MRAVFHPPASMVSVVNSEARPTRPVCRLYGESPSTAVFELAGAPVVAGPRGYVRCGLREEAPFSGRTLHRPLKYGRACANRAA